MQGKLEYTKQPVYLPGAKLTTSAINSSSADTAAGLTVGTESCADCIRGTGDGVTNVWCSAAWNYSYTVLPITEAYPSAKVTYTFSLTGGANLAATGTGDLGGCCYPKSVVA